MKSGNLNILEPSVPLQACNGTALQSITLHERLELKKFELQLQK